MYFANSAVFQSVNIKRKLQSLTLEYNCTKCLLSPPRIAKLGDSYSGDITTFAEHHIKSVGSSLLEKK